MKDSKNPFETADFKALQVEWYQKLKKEGFDDIEIQVASKTYLKVCHSNYFSCRYSPEAFERKAEYFRLASIFLEDYPFTSELDRLIWQKHSEGYGLRTIANLLLEKGILMSKDKVNRVVLQLRSLMQTQGYVGKGEE